MLVDSSSHTSVLNEESSSIAFHSVRECVARDEMKVCYINTLDSIVDLLTKPLMRREKRIKFTRMILYHI